MSTKPKDIGILMAGEMVRAAMSANPDERKTVTRRLVKVPRGYEWDERDDGSMWPHYIAHAAEDTDSPWLPHRFGEHGRRMWVRETWRLSWWDENGRAGIAYRADGADVTKRADVQDYDVWIERESDRLLALGAKVVNGDLTLLPGVVHPWRPSLLMPRWAARLWLRRDGDVTCERLHDITEEDAKREGMALVRRERGWNLTLRETFARYIDEVNGKGTWIKNPFVWRVPFVREEGWR